ncbi:MAG: hypothetical protein M1827_003734 [Pycnora praestabilis]|nr:MAG: hypothetical protein M1827_003734 [Pycnora praestabilis]
MLLGGGVDDTPLLWLDATLEAINTTHVNVSIYNPYTFELDVLGWNSIFEDQHEASSFSVKHDVSGRSVELTEGPGYTNSMYLSPDPVHFHRIGPQSPWIGIFDLTQLFDVKTQDTYDVSLLIITQAVIVKSGTTLNVALAAVNHDESLFPTVIIEAKAVPMFLTQSAELQKRGNVPAFSVSGDFTCGTSLNAAKAGAQQLAQNAAANLNSDIWIEYNNGPQTVWNSVNSVFNAIAGFLSGTAVGSTSYSEACDKLNNNPLCGDPSQRRGGFYQKNAQGGDTLTFCNAYFDLSVGPSCAASSLPGPSNPRPNDQSNAYLHELTHIPSLGGGSIQDGSKTLRIYTWKWSTWLASKRQGPRWDDKTVGQIDDVRLKIPEEVASNYQWYAVEANAMNPTSCPPNSPDHTELRKLLVVPGSVPSYLPASGPAPDLSLVNVINVPGDAAPTVTEADMTLPDDSDPDDSEGDVTDDTDANEPASPSSTTAAPSGSPGPNLGTGTINF